MSKYQYQNRIEIRRLINELSRAAFNTDVAGVDSIEAQILDLIPVPLTPERVDGIQADLALSVEPLGEWAQGYIDACDDFAEAIKQELEGS